VTSVLFSARINRRDYLKGMYLVWSNQPTTNMNDSQIAVIDGRWIQLCFNTTSPQQAKSTQKRRNTKRSTGRRREGHKGGASRPPAHFRAVVYTSALVPAIQECERRGLLTRVVLKGDARPDATKLENTVVEETTTTESDEESKSNNAGKQTQGEYVSAPNVEASSSTDSQSNEQDDVHEQESIGPLPIEGRRRGYGTGPLSDIPTTASEVNDETVGDGEVEHEGTASIADGSCVAVSDEGMTE
jgi:hypothetical protein